MKAAERIGLKNVEAYESALVRVNLEYCKKRVLSVLSRSSVSVKGHTVCFELNLQSILAYIKYQPSRICLLVKNLSTANFLNTLKGKSELEITVKGRKTSKSRSTPVWFVDEGNKIYLLPVKGSDTEWFKNVLKDPKMTLSVGRISIHVKAEPITKHDQVQKVIGSFAKKYGGISEIKRWYTKLDIAVEILV